MKTITLPVIDHQDKEFQLFLKRNKVKLEIVGEHYGFLQAKLTGEENNLIKVLDDSEFGWDGDYEKEWIEDIKVKE